MKNLLAASALFAFAGAAHADPETMTWIGMIFGTDDVEAGVICTVSEVTVVAATQEDCEKIGGQATHSVTHTATPIEE